MAETIIRQRREQCGNFHQTFYLFIYEDRFCVMISMRCTRNDSYVWLVIKVLCDRWAWSSFYGWMISGRMYDDECLQMPSFAWIIESSIGHAIMVGLRWMPHKNSIAQSKVMWKMRINIRESKIVGVDKRGRDNIINRRWEYSTGNVFFLR